MHLHRAFRPFLLILAFLAAAPSLSRAVQQATLSDAAKNAGDDYLRALSGATQLYQTRQFDKALDKLNIADQIAPNIPDTFDLRGAIFAEQHAYEKAEDAFEKAAQLNPTDFWPPYNVAELLLMEKKYSQSVAAFQKLEVYASQHELVQFKIVYANLLDGKNDAAKAALDAMKFPSETAAYYYAKSAYGFATKNSKEGSYWSDEGLKVFGLNKCLPFYDALAQVGWLPMRNFDGSVPVKQSLNPAPVPLPSGLDVPTLSGS